MNLIGYLCYALGFFFVISTIDAINPRDKQNDPEFYDSLSIENLSKTKRPFCNAFTGCGKKRSFYTENTLENQEKSIEKIPIPLPIYRALLRAAAGREILQNYDRESRTYNTEIDEFPYSDLAKKAPSREIYES